MALTMNIKGKLVAFDTPKVAGIVNVTPDSFYSGSRSRSAADVRRRVEEMLEAGAAIIDIGGYSSRPGAPEVSADEEYSRLACGLEAVREVAPDVPVSVDTFRASVARRCVEEWDADIINDISGGTLDPEMWPIVAELRVPYVLMHMRGNPETMQTLTDYDDVTAEVITGLSRKVYELRGIGVNDIIIDPGFGFAKTAEQNFRLLGELREFKKIGLPLLVGVSRKSMICNTLGCSPEESLYGTAAAQTVALCNGADIIRTHDVKAAVDAVKIVCRLRDAQD